MHEQALLNAARRLSSPEERMAYLTAACRGQPELLRRLQAKLLASDPPDDAPVVDTSEHPGEVRGIRSSQNISSIDTARSMAGTPVSPADHPDEIPERFGRYKILGLLGKGGMGAVYLARDTMLERDVALKIPTLSAGAEGEDVVERFTREARAAGNLHHPNICPVYDVGEIEGRQYLTMRYVEGRPLSRFINPEKPQNPRNVAVVVRKLASALAEAHQAGIVHRDLKPANVMMDGKNEPIVMDFGLARRIHGAGDLQLTQSGMIVGTPAYMSPEQIAGDPSRIGPATDIWSLGVMLFELLTGRLPFEGSVLQVIGAIQHRDPPAPSSLREGIPARLDQICRKMLTRDPEQRYRTMDEVSTDLTNFLRDPAGASAAAGETYGLAFSSDPRAASPTQATGLRTRVSAARPPATEFEREPVASRTEGVFLPPPPPVRSPRRRETSTKRPGWLIPAVAGFFALLLIVAAVRQFRARNDATILIQVDNSLRSDALQLTVNGDTYRLSSEGREIRIAPGSHVLEVARGATLFRSQPVAFGNNERCQLRLLLVDGFVNLERIDSNNLVQSVSLAIAGPTQPGTPAASEPVVLVPMGKQAGDQWAANGLKMKFRWCPPGTFLMGSPASEPVRQSQPDEGNEDQVPVSLTAGFWMGEFEVTQAQWTQLMGTNVSQQRDKFIASLPLYGEGPEYPIYYVNFTEATEFCRRFTQQEREAGRLPSDWSYRLPSEAQWEYACRAGSTTATAFGNDLSSRQANFNGEVPYNRAERGPNLKQTAPVGSYSPNVWGLCDMHGNVWEFCRDSFRDNLTGGRDPEVTSETGKWSHRGGGWRGAGRRNRSAVRAGLTASEVSFDLGFRVVLMKTAP